jgi:hypothetical protein
MRMKYSARKFVQESYDRNDEWGKSIVLRWLSTYEDRFHVIQKQGEDYGVDIQVNAGENVISFEVEVKHGYPFTSADTFPFDSVSFLGRKRKFGKFWYVVVCAETEAICICHSDEIYQEKYREIKTIATSERNGLDEFYRVPKDKCSFYADTKTKKR